MRREEFQLRFFMCVIESRQVVRTTQSTAGEASTSNMTIPESKADDQWRLDGMDDDPSTVGPVSIPDTGEA